MASDCSRRQPSHCDGECRHSVPGNPDRNAVRVLHLTAGLAFLSLTATWALWTAGILDTGALHWFVPMTWVASGALATVPSMLACLLGRRH